jgi:membrane protein YqaA with SNARE-associated domain
MPPEMFEMTMARRQRFARIALGVLLGSIVGGVVIWRMRARIAGRRAP